jgi:hypothetical protein
MLKKDPKTGDLKNFDELINKLKEFVPEEDQLVEDVCDFIEHWNKMFRKNPGKELIVDFLRLGKHPWMAITNTVKEKTGRDLSLKQLVSLIENTKELASAESVDAIGEAIKRMVKSEAFGKLLELDKTMHKETKG